MSPRHGERSSMAQRSIVLLAWLLALAGCGNNPPTPDWKLNAQSALERGASAYLEGRNAIAELEFASARRDIARTGRLDLLARAELTRCAARVASLQFEPCAAFEALRDDAPAAERAYAAYLAGRATAADAALLPEQHRAFASPGRSEAAIEGALRTTGEPLARQIAAAVLLQGGRASPSVIAQAIDTASAQGWRRPLLAWLTLQAERAQAAGDTVSAQALRRRIALVEGAR